VESLEHTSNSGLANPEAFLEELDVKEKEAKSKKKFDFKESSS